MIKNEKKKLTNEEVLIAFNNCKPFVKALASIGTFAIINGAVEIFIPNRKNISIITRIGILIAVSALTGTVSKMEDQYIDDRFDTIVNICNIMLDEEKRKEFIEKFKESLSSSNLEVQS